MFLASVSLYLPFVCIKNLLPVNFHSVSSGWFDISEGYIFVNISLCSEELRKEARQLKRELLEAKQKKEERALRPREKEGKRFYVDLQLTILVLKVSLGLCSMYIDVDYCWNVGVFFLSLGVVVM